MIKDRNGTKMYWKLNSVLIILYNVLCIYLTVFQIEARVRGLQASVCCVPRLATCDFPRVGRGDLHWKLNSTMYLPLCFRLKRGYEVFKQVCAACHALRHVTFRELVGVIFTGNLTLQCIYHCVSDWSEGMRSLSKCVLRATPCDTWLSESWSGWSSLETKLYNVFTTVFQIEARVRGLQASVCCVPRIATRDLPRVGWSDLHWKLNSTMYLPLCFRLKRGYEVFKQVCAACHALRHVTFRELVGVIFTGNLTLQCIYTCISDWSEGTRSSSKCVLRATHCDTWPSESWSGWSSLRKRWRKKPLRSGNQFCSKKL